MLDNLKQWLSNIYEGIKDTIVGYWEKFLDVVLSVLDWVRDTIVYCGQMIWDFFFHEEKGILWQLLKMFGEWVVWFIDQVPDVSQILDEYSSPVSTTMELLSKFDLFFPLTEAVSLFGIFITFLLIFLVVKLILKLIPTVG